MRGFFAQEPVLVVNAVTAVIEAGIALAIAFGLPITTAQFGAVMTFVIAVGAMIQVLIVRAQVTPLANPKNNEGVPLEPAAAPAPAPPAGLVEGLQP
jgi:hypothetical protein